MKLRNLCAIAPLLLPLAAHALVFGGEIQRDGAQAIFTPPSNSSPVVLRYYVPDGTRVQPGDVLVRIDAGQAAVDLRALDAQLEQAKAKIAKEVAELELKAFDAELEFIDAQAALDTAKVDAVLPRQLLSALDYDSAQAEFARATKDSAFKSEALANARAGVARRVDDGKLEIEKLLVQRRYDEVQLQTAEVRAENAGTVVHGFSTFGSNGRIEEGSSSYPGEQIGTVSGAGAPHVRAWVLEPDRAALRVGQPLRLGFDALSGQSVIGKISSISGASQAKPEWGSGYYFVVDVTADDWRNLPLRPGMSVRAETIDSDASAGAIVASQTAAVESGETVRASGEVYAQTTAAVSPPIVEDLWELTVTQMAGDGQMVKKGETIVTFDGAEVLKQLTAKQSELQEKLRTQEKLKLQLAELERKETVASAQAHAEAVKAARKAAQPPTYVPGVEYKKLVIARTKAERRDAVSQEREKAAARERLAEQQAADADVARLKAAVERLQAGLSRLTIAAPRDGTFLHATTFRGDKIEVGTQVWRGISVGEIPDMGTLAVRATLDERDVSKVAVGDRVRVLLEGGGGRSFGARIEDIGISVHSKSRVEPVPVVDLRIALDAGATALKPGQPVRVEIIANSGTHS
ncbi:MAG TPA: efflux RND transporter periplasmic adaptor subunit [Rudaea sp.]